MSGKKKTSVRLLIEEFEAMRETASQSTAYLLNAMIRKMEEFLPVNEEEIKQAFYDGRERAIPPPYDQLSARENSETYFKFNYDNTRRDVKLDDNKPNEIE